ncbi:MAG: hypothetical protein AB7R89_09030 [Dehalococcoidia bacterium]
MANQQDMIIRDDNGIFYLIPGDVVEQYRVPEEQQAELEAALADDEVSGYFFSFGPNAGSVNQNNTLPANNQSIGTPSNLVQHHIYSTGARLPSDIANRFRG